MHADVNGAETDSGTKERGVVVMTSQTLVQGSIVDSWVERGAPYRDESRLVLQVAPRGCPGDIWIVEASPSLLPDAGWLDDLRENLCHGSPIAAVGLIENDGCLIASALKLER